MLKIIRIKNVKDKTGYKANSSVYAHVSDETLPPPVKIGKRASGWIEPEVDTIIAARIGGKTDVEIRHLVRELVAKRVNVLSVILANSSEVSDEP